MAEYRALQVFAEAPVECLVIPVSSDANAPHLKAGEFAIVDPNQTSLINGEVFAFQWNSGHRDFCQTMLRPARGIVMTSHPDVTDFWWVVPMNMPRSKGEFDDAVRSGRMLYSTDGPYLPEDLEKKIVGRVVGILETATAA